MYYSVSGKVIRKLDKNGIVTNVVGSMRNNGNYEDIATIQDYYYALDRELIDIGGLIIDTKSNDIYYLNNGIYMERIRNSDKKSIIAVGYGTNNELPSEGLGNQINFAYNYPSYNNYVRGLAINGKNEIFIVQRSSISKYNIGNYSVTNILTDFEPGTYSQIVLSKDETFLFAKNGEAIDKISMNGQVTFGFTSISNLMSIDTVDNELYMLTLTGVYVFRNNSNQLIAAGSSGSFVDGMNSTNLLINYGTTMLVDDNKDIYLTDLYSSVILKIDHASQLVTNLLAVEIPTSSETVYSAKNFTSRGISHAVHNKVNGFVYMCDSNGNVFEYDNNLVSQKVTGYSCIDIAVNSLGEVYFLSNYYIYQLLSNGTVITFAGDGTWGVPINGTYLDQNPVAAVRFGFYSNNDMFLQSSYYIFRVDHTTKFVQQIYSSTNNELRITIIDPDTDNLYTSEGSSISLVYPNGIAEIVAGINSQPAVRSFKRKISLSDVGEDAFANYINPTGMSIGADGKLYISYQYMVKRLENGLLWTQQFVDTQQGPMSAAFISDVVILGRFGDAIMLTNPNGNIYLLNPVSSFTCFGNLPSSSSVCSGYGSCVGPNRCNCQNTNFGFECEYSTCFDVSGFDYQTVCGGVGKCSIQDQCSCPSGYTGTTCSTPLYNICYGISSNSSNVCSGKGSCVSTDSCKCNAGRVGSYCQYEFCASTWNANSETLTCAVPSSSSVEVNQEIVAVNQLSSKVLRFSRTPSVSITFPSDFYSYVLKAYPEIGDQLTVVSSIYDPTLDTSQELLVVSSTASVSVFKNTSDILPVYNLPNPIVIQFNSIKIDKTGGSFNYSCMYYDTASNSWSSSGIKSTITSSQLSSTYYTFSLKCETYHLTSFSVIDMNYKKTSRDDTLQLGGLTTGGIIALAVTLGGAGLICIVVGIIVAAIIGVCMWTKHNKKKNMAN